MSPPRMPPGAQDHVDSPENQAVAVTLARIMGDRIFS